MQEQTAQPGTNPAAKRDKRDHSIDPSTPPPDPVVIDPVTAGSPRPPYGGPEGEGDC